MPEDFAVRLDRKELASVVKTKLQEAYGAISIAMCSCDSELFDNVRGRTQVAKAALQRVLDLLS